ncbi:MAG: hypothetical protein P8165_06930 [Deltaproteobacteria bacterium]
MKLYVFDFDQHTEKELIRLSFYWVPLMLFGILGVMALRIKKINTPLLFAIVGTLLGTAALAGFLMLAFLS